MIATTNKMDMFLSVFITERFSAKTKVQTDDTIRYSLSIRHNILHKASGILGDGRLTWV